MYSLTLTRDERSAIDWIGHRYSHGDILSAILRNQCEIVDDKEWSEPGDIQYLIPEHVAWEICDIINEDSLACFSDKFTQKLWEFTSSVV